MTIPKQCLQFIIKNNTVDASQQLLAWGWGDSDKFVLPLGIESWINHDSIKCNCERGVATKLIRCGEEILEDYNTFDYHVPWYIELTKELGVWTAPLSLE